jgi:branched-chain amino acid aminotransferase
MQGGNPRYLRMSFLLFNGKIYPADAPLIAATNRGLRYGDGIFETIRMVNNDMPLFDLHMQRFFNGLSTLKFHIPAHFTANVLKQQIEELSKKNATAACARIRISAFRGNGGLYDPENHWPNYIIESTPLPGHYLQWNENGLDLGLYADARKSCDGFSNLKSNNYLPYVMAAIFAKENKYNDCVVLNQHNRICDATIANLFWIKNEIVYTPALSEGCVAGVMRQHILATTKEFEIKETAAPRETLLDADEIFLTNAAYGIRWVKNFEQSKFDAKISAKIYQQLLRTIA